MKIEIVPSQEELAERGLDIFLGAASEAISQRGMFSVGLAGGNTPEKLYTLLGRDERARDLNWEKIHIFFGDERAVPPDDKRSNYRLARLTFLEAVGIRDTNVHRIKAETGDLDEAAQEYEGQLNEVFGSEVPVFDMILLGMGADGHTASLFPGDSENIESDSLVCAVYRSGNEPDRISLGPRALRAGRRIVVLVAGSHKAEVLREVMTESPDPLKRPIRTLWEVPDKVLWLADSDAASLL